MKAVYPSQIDFHIKGAEFVEKRGPHNDKNCGMATVDPGFDRCDERQVATDYMRRNAGKYYDV